MLEDKSQALAVPAKDLCQETPVVCCRGARTWKSCCLWGIATLWRKTGLGIQDLRKVAQVTCFSRIVTLFKLECHPKTRQANLKGISFLLGQTVKESTL